MDFFRLAPRLGAVMTLLMLSIPAWSQGLTRLSGRVVDGAGTAVSSATVSLFLAGDSSLAKTEFTDETGRYTLEAAAGRYWLEVTHVGLAKRKTEPFDLQEGGRDQPLLVMPAAEKELAGVEVQTQRPLFEKQADRTVVNVENSVLAAGQSALDVLARSPGVTVDAQGNIALRGRQGALFLVDGRRQPMTGAELADMLRGLPAEQLKNIELITNPPARYDAQGTAGVIAINLKKDRRLGTNGSLNAAYGRGYWGKFNTGLSLNHRTKGLNVYGSYAHADRRGFNNLNLTREYLQNDSIVARTHQVNDSRIHYRSHTAKAGADWTASKRTTFGILGTGMVNHGEGSGSNNTSLYNPADTVVYHSANTKNNRWGYGAFNGNFRHTFADTAGAPALTADVDYAGYRNSPDQVLKTFFPQKDSSSVLFGEQNGWLTIGSVKADFTGNYLGGGLEAGAKFSQVHSDNDVVYTLKQNDGPDSIDRGKTNHFTYDERISAGYFTYSRPYAHGDWKLGARYEYTNAIGRQAVGSQGFARHYGNIFPSAGITRKLGKDHQVSLSLASRIERPGYQQLNPFRQYIDATTYGAGNPYLLPQRSYQVEAGYTLKDKYSATLTYIVDYRPLIGTVQPENADSRIVVSTTQNLDRVHFLILSFSLPFEPVPGWSLYNNANIYYQRVQGQLAGTTLNRTRVQWDISHTQTLKLGQGWTADLNAEYRSRELYGYMLVLPLGQLSLGVQKAVLGKRGTLKLNATDLFYTQPVRATSTYANYVEHFRQPADSRVVTLAFTYRFGNEGMPPARRRNGGAEDEMRRAG